MILQMKTGVILFRLLSTNNFVHLLECKDQLYLARVTTENIGHSVYKMRAILHTFFLTYKEFTKYGIAAIVTPLKVII